MTKPRLRQPLLILLWILSFTIVLPAQFYPEEVGQSEKDKGLSGKLDLAFALAKGNSDSLLLEGALLLSYRTKKYYFSIGGNLLYEEKDRQSFVSKGAMQVRGIRWLSKRLMVEAFARKEYDKFILLKDRTQAGGGMSYRVVKAGAGASGEERKGNLAIDVGIGLLWEAEQYEPTGGEIEKEDSSSLMSKNYLAVKWQLSQKLLFKIVGDFLFDTGHLEAYRFELQADLEVKINKFLSYQTKLQYRYDNAPPPTVKPYDIYLKNGLSIQF
jgi:hypothetical protein